MVTRYTTLHYWAVFFKEIWIAIQCSLISAYSNWLLTSIKILVRFKILVKFTLSVAQNPCLCNVFTFRISPEE